MSSRGRNKRRFALGTTGGPDFHNLQLYFWDRAIDAFKQLSERYQKHAVFDDNDASDEYTEDDFIVEAAGVLVLAGTSVSELVGQNSEIDSKGRTPDVRVALTKWFGDVLPGDVKAFIKIYDDLRHFGPAKYEAALGITIKSVTKHLTTAQTIWKTILTAEGMPPQRVTFTELGTKPVLSNLSHFRHDFSFRD